MARKKIFFIVGEPSADAIGAALIKTFQSRGVDVECVGIGGPQMEARGFQSKYPMDDLCVMGLFEVLGQLPRLLGLIKDVVRHIEDEKPDMVLTIDLPDFNFEVVKRLRKKSFPAKCVHYVAPTVWAWRAGRAKMLSRLYDALLCVLPFEPDHFTAHGLDARFVGHPLVERSNHPNPQRFRKAHGFDQNERIIGLFFGSRAGEINQLSDEICAAAKILQEADPDIQFLAPTLPQHEDRLKAMLKQKDLDAKIVSSASEKWDSFSACDAAIAVSGTVGLELAYLGVPHLVAYKAHPVTIALAKMLVKIEHIHLANIIMDQKIIPEYIQDEANAKTMASTIQNLLEDQAVLNKQKEGMEVLQAMLRPIDEQGPSDRAVDILLEILDA